jgi:hypothetical protein
MATTSKRTGARAKATGTGTTGTRTTGTRAKQTAAASSSGPRTTAASARAESTKQEGVTCTVPFCPICTVVTSAQQLQPEILGHLMAAAREFALAARAMVDARTDQVAPPTRLQRIDLA